VQSRNCVCSTQNHISSALLAELSNLVQNFGLRDGLPGTDYNKGVKAAESIEAILIPVLREALANEEEVMKQGTILGRLMQGLREEGAGIMNASRDAKAEYFATECSSLMFAGVTCSLKLCRSEFAPKSECITRHTTHLINHERMHEYVDDVFDFSQVLVG
jgi:hypothetical protein